MDQSSPGQFKPTPPPTQKAPKADKRTPTQNFSVFSGIAVSGLWMASPSSTTHNSAAKAPMLAGINKPTPPAPTAMTMKTTSSPSSMAILNEVATATLSQPPP